MSSLVIPVVHTHSRLKAHKIDGSTGLTGDHVITAGDDCYTHMALLFTAIVVHGFVPDSFFLYSTIVPIRETCHTVLIFEVLLWVHFMIDYLVIDLLYFFAMANAIVRVTVWFLGQKFY